MVVSLLRYALASFALAGITACHAWTTRGQLFPALVLLTNSKIAIVVLGNFALTLLLLAGRVLKAVFLGSLRESESERLYERVKESLMETCIAMTIFREEFSVSFVSYFSLLLFLKVFHWLATDRVEFLETTPTVTRLQHARCTSLVVFLLLVDILFLREAIVSMTTQGMSVVLLFAFEYIILATTCINIATKYAFYCIDVQPGLVLLAAGTHRAMQVLRLPANLTHARIAIVAEGLHARHRLDAGLYRPVRKTQHEIEISKNAK